MPAKLLGSELPYWPRLLSLPLAAAFVGVSEASYRRGVAQGFWPRPLKITNKPRGKRGRTLWDRRVLEARVDELSGLITAADPAPLPIRHIVTLPPAPKRKHVLR